MTSDIWYIKTQFSQTCLWVLEIVIVIVQCGSAAIELDFSGTGAGTEPREELNLEKNQTIFLFESENVAVIESHKK